MMLQFVGSIVYAQTIKVTGTVTDAKGESLPGVSVKVKGTAIGSTTSADGKYTVNVLDATSVLVFSYIGYIKQEEVVGTRKNISVKLKEDESSLNEVVVTGFGQTMPKKDLTGATVGVGAQAIAERQPTTLSEALQGQAAGVLVTTDGGSPSGQGNIQIRGLSSINAGNGPLYIIDGITSENADFVNPMDIADIQILKDASSTAVYGSRGGNGVILITTKKGQDGKPNIGLSYNNIFGRLAHKLHTLSSDELRKYRSMRSGGSGAIPDSLNPYTNADNDFQDLLFRTSNRKVVALSASGGTKGSTYYAGINYTDDQAIILNSSLKRLQTKLNVESKLTSKLTFSNNLAFAYQTGNEIPVGTSAKQVFEKNPWTSIYRPDGSYAGYIESKRNPVAYAMLTQDVDNNYTVQYNTKTDYAFSKYLKISGLFNATLDTKGNNFFSPSSLTNGGTGTATGSNTFSRRFKWEGQTYLNYQRTFNNDHTVTVNAGLTSDRTKNESFTIGMMNYLTEAINNSSAGTVDLTKTKTDGWAVSSAAAFIRGNYSYKGRYILQANYRRDGSSRFGPLRKWGDFTSGSAAWRFSDEKFMSFSKSWLDDAKLRFSYGEAGNDNIGNYLYENNMEFGVYNYNVINSATENLTMGNPEIQWESVNTTNLGADFTLLKGKISLTLDYYDKTTSNLLYKTEIPKETGKSNATINLGTIRNKGFEFTINATPFRNKDFSWNTSYNMSFQRGKVVKLANGVPLVAGNIFKIREGGRIGDMFVYKNLGVYQYDSSNAYTPDGIRLTPDLSTLTILPGDAKMDVVSRYFLNGQEYTGEIKRRMNGVNVLRAGDTEWLDVNNDNVIDDADLVNIGNGLPDFYFGFSNTFKYKRFSLNVLFNGQVGNKVYNSVANGQNTGSSTYSPPTYQMITNSWWEKGDVALYPNILAKDDRGSIRNGYNSLYVEDGSFIRLSSARLTYALDQKWATKVKMRNASIFVYGTNLATWTKYSWYDPEFTSSNALTPGVDGGKYPRRREVGFGVNFNF
ncbi:MAG: TonB-dependent receptor [Candidatus Pedobacter colombiensis]|uniref:TonB-dependent receptor n=1 Tax=Candidatus Pedobacter colombiensis TaxID=3121371 RepID=A0AAJ6B896_9SPHI|nr:TonB-dependent receptor [Pedobacter sp.]WEK18903.1 MAG: TonB-dependent receptor [Pedobacter sp.]